MLLQLLDPDTKRHLRNHSRDSFISKLYFHPAGPGFPRKMLPDAANKTSPASGPYQNQMVLLFLNSEVLWSFFFHLAWLTITGVLCSSTLDIEPSDATVVSTSELGGSTLYTDK
jgi:hypothetical protein